MANTEINKLTNELKIRDLQLKSIELVDKAKYCSETKKEFFIEIIRSIQIFIKSGACLIVFPNSNTIFSDAEFNDHELMIQIANDALKATKPLIINDVLNHKRLRKLKIRNFLAFAVKNENYVLILANKVKGFTEFDCFVLSLISKEIQKQMQVITLKQELNLKQKELEVIDHINTIKSTIKDLEVLLDTVINEIIKLIPAEAVVFLMYDKNKKEHSIKVTGKHPKSPFIRNNIQILHKVSSYTLNQAELARFSKLSQDIESVLSVPILLTEGMTGIICVINPKNKEGFTKKDIALLNAIAKQIGYAIFEDLEKLELKKTFQRYVAPEVIETMLKDKDKDYMKVEKKEVTVLFSDLRGFTALSERLPAEKIVEILNEHFETMTSIILKHKGTIDKFIGDCIMAVFGAPIYYESHALRAIKVALEMQQAQDELSKKWKQQGIDVNIGIGINTGEVVIGNIGSSQRTDYTVIGDTVNVASRLCSNAEGSQILVSERTHSEVGKAVKFLKELSIKVKGKTNPLSVYVVKELN